jgi:hypothetical protein
MIFSGRPVDRDCKDIQPDRRMDQTSALTSNTAPAVLANPGAGLRTFPH